MTCCELRDAAVNVNGGVVNWADPDVVVRRCIAFVGEDVNVHGHARASLQPMLSKGHCVLSVL